MEVKREEGFLRMDIFTRLHILQMLPQHIPDIIGGEKGDEIAELWEVNCINVHCIICMYMYIV